MSSRFRGGARITAAPASLLSALAPPWQGGRLRPDLPPRGGDHPLTESAHGDLQAAAPICLLPAQRSHTEATILPNISSRNLEAFGFLLGQCPTPFRQVPRCLGLHPDQRPTRAGMPARDPYAAHFLARTHFYACLHETPRDFHYEAFESITLCQLSSWFPDRSGIMTELPQTWSVAQASAQMDSCPLLMRHPQILLLH